MKKYKKAKKKTNNTMVINVKTVVKNATKLNVSGDALSEMRELTEDLFIPLLVRYAEKAALNSGKKTIQENDYLVAKDYVTTAFKSYGLI